MNDNIVLNHEGTVPKLKVGLSWYHNEQKAGVLDTSVVPHNLDLTCAVIGQDKKVLELISPHAPKRSKYKEQIFHMGDHLSGGSDFEDEEIVVSLDKVSEDIHALVFVVSVNGKVTFSDVKNAALEFMDGITLDSFLSFDFLGAEKAALMCGLLVRDGNGWLLQSVREDIAAVDETLIQESLKAILK